MLLLDYPLATTPLTGLVFVNWACCLFTTLTILFLYSRKRFLFVKPSILVVVATHVFIQIPATVFSGFYEVFLPNPFSFYFLIHTFTIVGLYLSTLSQNKNAQIIWQKIIHPDSVNNSNRRSIIILSVLSLLTVMAYLSKVPLTQTGLYAIFEDPVHAAIMREESLKLLDNPIIVYSFSIMSSAMAPLLVGLLGISIWEKFQTRHFFYALLATTFILGTMIAVSLPGARVAVVRLLLVLVLLKAYHSALPMRPLRAIIILLLIVSPAVFLSIFREGESFSFSFLFNYFGFIFYRAFVETFEVGGWLCHFVQTNGLFGVSAIPKLARVFSETPVDVANFIGLLYASAPGETVSATCGYIFVYYSVAGLWSLPISIALLLMLDIILPLIKNYSGSMLLAFIASLVVISLSFVQSDFTTVLITQGFITLLVLSFFLNFLSHKRFSRSVSKFVGSFYANRTSNISSQQ